MLEQPSLYRHAVPTRTVMAVIGLLVVIFLLGFCSYILLSARHGIGSLLLFGFAIAFVSYFLIMVVWGIIHPDATECVVDATRIRWHVPGPFQRNGIVRLADIAEVHAGIGGGPGSSVEVPVPLEFILRNGARVKIPWVCYGNYPRPIIEAIAPLLPNVPFYIDGTPLRSSQIRPIT